MTGPSSSPRGEHSPRYPCPTGRHHQHPGLTCDEYDTWRRDIDAAINPKEPS